MTFPVLSSDLWVGMQSQLQPLERVVTQVRCWGARGLGTWGLGARGLEARGPGAMLAGACLWTWPGVVAPSFPAGGLCAGQPGQVRGNRVPAASSGLALRPSRSSEARGQTFGAPIVGDSAQACISVSRQPPFAVAGGSWVASGAPHFLAAAGQRSEVRGLPSLLPPHIGLCLFLRRKGEVKQVPQPETPPPPPASPCD